MGSYVEQSRAMLEKLQEASTLTLGAGNQHFRASPGLGGHCQQHVVAALTQHC